MRRAAVKGLWGRKLRTSLTALAVILGVAMVSGTYVLTDTIKHAFDSIFSGSYKNTSAVISGRQIVSQSTSGNATIPESLLGRVKRVPGVASASGAIFDVGSTSDTAKLIDKSGNPITTGGAPTFGWGIDTSQSFNPFTLESGRWASRPSQVVIDAGTASKHDFAVGDRIGVSAQGPTRTFQISGIAKFGSVDSIGGATFAIFEVPTAQKLLGKQGRFDAIYLSARPGTSPGELVGDVKPLLPPSAQVKTAAQQAQANAKDTNDAVKFFQYILLAFAAIALLVGSFVIFNTLSMTVAQRVRELATLRTLGASRRQVLGSVLLEGLIIGVAASVIGLFAGILLAKGLNALFVGIGIDLPRKGTVIETRTVIVSLIVGIGVTVAAAISPARRATRVPPVAAVREGATLPRTRLATQSSKAGFVLIAVASAALAYSLFANGLGTGLTLLTVGLGCLALFIGVGFLSRRAVAPVAAVVGAPGERLSATGRLARENATRNPTRTARTAAALMIGLALVTLVATLGAGLRQSDKDAIAKQVQADYVVTSHNGFDPFAAGAGRAVSNAPPVQVASSVRSDHVRAFGSDTSITGIDPPTIDRVFNHQWSDGSNRTLGQLDHNGAIVTKRFADDHALAPGDAFTVTTPQGKRLNLKVKGTVDPPFDQLDSLMGKIEIPTRTFDANFSSPKNLYTFVDVAGGFTPRATAALDHALAPFSDTKLQTRSAWIDNHQQGLKKILNLFYVLLALSVIISLFGMVNALVLAVFERTRELGMLRAVGMTRRQARGMVRQESVITALIGAALGLPLGILLAAIVTRALRSQDISFALPLGTLLALAAGAVLAGILAAILPARRASRINVLEALQYE
jgi:putative ABC transport system permease protein